jgi:hypothetical protein
MGEVKNRSKLWQVSDEVITAYTTNAQTLSQIAKFHDVSTGTVRNLLISKGVTLRQRGRRSAQVEAPVTDILT